MKLLTSAPMLTSTLLLIALTGGLMAPPGVASQGIDPLGGREGRPDEFRKDAGHVEGPSPLLEQVPYLSQTPLLCGGAAAAMVTRFWGKRGAYPEDYEHLVRSDEGGIRISDLADALKAGGWDVHLINGSPDAAGTLIDGGVPVIALQAVGSEEFHYVVLLEWGDDSIRFHDPAIGPGLREDKARFLEQWRETGYRGVVVLPREGPDRSGPSRPGPENLRDDNGRRYPEGSDAVRARAAFDEERYAEAEELARRSVRSDPEDSAAWRILAASLFLQGEKVEALSAWNRIGRPRIDLRRIHGLTTVTHPKALSRLGTEEGEILTPDRMRLAQKRLRAVPSVSRVRVAYAPNPDGSVELHLYAMESDPFWDSWRQVAGLTLDGLTREHAAIRIPGLLGEGEAMEAGVSWMRARSSASLEFSTPSTPLPGVVSVRGSWLSERYLGPDQPGNAAASSTATREEWKKLVLSLEDWVVPDLLLHGGFGVTDWREHGVFWGLEAEAYSLLAAETIGGRITGEVWVPAGSGTPFSVFHAESRWRRGIGDGQRVRAEVRAGFSIASENAPLSLRPGAGQGIVRPHLLRAHTLYRDAGILRERLNPTLWYGGAEVGTRGWQTGPFRFSPALFLDGIVPARDPIQLDLGASVRLILPGVEGWLEASVARGLMDDATAVSLAWRESWW